MAIRLLAITMLVLCGAVANGEKEEDGDANERSSNTFIDCLEDHGDTACESMKDDGNMNSACTHAASECWEMNGDDEGDDEDDNEGDDEGDDER